MLEHTGRQQMLKLVSEARTPGMGVVKSKSKGVRKNPKGSELPLNTDAGLLGLLLCVPCVWHKGPQRVCGSLDDKLRILATFYRGGKVSNFLAGSESSNR